MTIAFGEFELDPAARELRRGNQPVTIEPKAVDVLSMLIENHGRVVTKDELVEVVWRGRFISDSALSTAIKAARSAVGDDGRSQKIIRTLHGLGFRFVAKLIEAERHDAEKEIPSTDQVPTNLKRRRRTLIGREAEKTSIISQLKNRQIVSLVGPGGVGKTSLAVETAMECESHFPGGVWFCELAPVQEGQVESAVLGAIDSSAGAGPVDAAKIVERFGSKPTLLVLDNCEHVIETAARLVGQLYDLAPNLALLITSREALEINQENVIRIVGLNYDATDSVAVDMFYRCASQVTDLPRSEETDEVVRKIAERLEGLPLAIELAAPQLASHSPSELLLALDDQLSVLATRRRRGQARHSAMDDAIAWSYELLDPNQRDVLDGLSLFSGAFTVQAAEAVCDTADARRILHDLVGQSMVSFVPGNPISRFRLLEPIRQFADRKLDEERSQILQERHARWFAQRGVELGSEMRTPNEIEACEALTVEWSDLRRALAWGRAHREPDIAVEPLLALQIHLLWQLRIEAFGWLEEGVAACDLSDPMQARAEIVGSMGAWSAGDLDRCDAMIAESEHLAGERVGTAYLAFYVHFARENFDLAVERGRRAHQLAQAGDDPIWRVMAAAFCICGLAMAGKNEAEIAKLFEKIENELTLIPWPSGRCCLLLARIVAAFARGDAAELAKSRAEMEIAADRCHAPWFKLTADGMESFRAAQDEEEARRHLSMYASSVSSAIASGDVIQLPTILRSATICLIDLRNYDMAAKMSGLIPKLRGLGEKGSLSPGYEDALKRLQDRMEPEHFEALANIGSSWELTDVAEELQSAINE